MKTKKKLLKEVERRLNIHVSVSQFGFWPNDVDYKAVELDGNKYEVVNQFCYLGDVISAGGGAEASTIARLRFG